MPAEVGAEEYKERLVMPGRSRLITMPWSHSLVPRQLRLWCTAAEAPCALQIVRVELCLASGATRALTAKRDLVAPALTLAIETRETVVLVTIRVRSTVPYPLSACLERPIQ